ncbi:MAG: hypothetical protein ACRD8O_00555 [Bryobacteraceae bacterium]
MPYLRFGIVTIAMFLVAPILLGLTLKAAAEAAKLAKTPAWTACAGSSLLVDLILFLQLRLSFL